MVVIIEGKRPSLMPEGPVLEGDVLGPDWAVKRYGLLQDVPRDVLATAQAVIVRPGTTFGRDEMSRLRCCRVLISLGVGYEHIDLAAARERGLPVCNVPDYGVEEVADTAFAMILFLHRRLGSFARHARFHGIDWDWRILKSSRRARETTMGIIGLGRVGTSVALRAKAFGYRVIFYDPYVPRGVEKSVGVERVAEMAILLARSDIVTIHTPLTQETLEMVDGAFLDGMKADAILINVSRGRILKDLDVVYDALRRRGELAIGLDVLPQEPPESHPLLEAWRHNEEWLSGRFLLTPHAAFYSEDSCRELRRRAAELAKTVLDGHSPYNVVNT
jgi:D-3-phosphoglycerate dehydrogenase